MVKKEEQQIIFTTELVEEIRIKNDQGYKISRQEKYWAENYTLTKKDGIVFSLSDEESIEWIKCAKGIDIDGDPILSDKQIRVESGIEYFARKYCKIKNEIGKIDNVKLRDYQKELLNMFNDNRFSIVMAARQSGKTINSAITILYYCIFEVNKNILVAGNIAKTAEEILNKIKDIYYLLPFWLKPSVLVWNISQVTFGDTKCRIKTTATTKKAAIGNAVDLLYLDEFAHVDTNIAEDFYRSIFPTVSSMQNSKIIITSTPSGYNLFWKLLSEGELGERHKNWNRFHAKRVYWHQVPSRFVTYLRLNDYEILKNNLTEDDIYNWVLDLGFKKETLDENGFVKESGVRLVKNYETNKNEIHIPNKYDDIPNEIKLILEGKDWENPLSDFFRSSQYIIEENGEVVKRIKLLDLCDISSWKEDAIKGIGSLEAFNQEYDLQFLSGSKMVLDSSTMSKIENNINQFEYIELPQITKKSFIPYLDLLWIKDRPDIFTLADIKKYYICISIDISEGLNGDYSVINIFRLLPKKEDDWLPNITNIYDFFKLEQIGIFRCNTISVQELAEIAYLLIYEVLNENIIGVVFESNNWGGELTKTMKSMFDGRNRYSQHVFFRYKHRQDAIKPELGIKLRQNKNMFVKEYQKRIKQNDIVIHHQETLQEMTKFIKKETLTGYTFQAESGGNDDITMTIVELSTVFENVLFHDLCIRLLNELPELLRKSIEKRLSEAPQPEATDYTSLLNARRISSNRNMNQQVVNNNPYLTKNSSLGGWGLGGKSSLGGWGLK